MMKVRLSPTIRFYLDGLRDEARVPFGELFPDVSRLNLLKVLGRGVYRLPRGKG